MEKEKFFIAQQYLDASKNLLQGITDCHNINIVISDEPVSEEERTEATRHNSFSIIIPSIFCLYHGLELMIKAFLMVDGSYKKTTHSISDVLDVFKAKYPTEFELYESFLYITDYSKTPIVKSFAEENEINSVDKLYQALRYDDVGKESKSVYDYSILKTGLKNDDYLDDIKALIESIDKIFEYGAPFYHRLEDEYETSIQTSKVPS